MLSRSPREALLSPNSYVPNLGELARLSSSLSRPNRSHAPTTRTHLQSKSETVNFGINGGLEGDLEPHRQPDTGHQVTVRRPRRHLRLPHSSTLAKATDLPNERSRGPLEAQASYVEDVDGFLPVLSRLEVLDLSRNQIRRVDQVSQLSRCYDLLSK
ncbi:unnamed protein product [Protopolystoma xenopodis]|uniref:U2A'/phosphoprotein 32 family A C-terminal domain-containing protein n=1 Tax=Protopolystoma xenopodis TaxID=117903 RepID=A0A448WDQ0_9PLAT|nr:unnamed protein product [Protopolystoma xenopodis]